MIKVRRAVRETDAGRLGAWFLGLALVAVAGVTAYVCRWASSPASNFNTRVAFAPIVVGAIGSTVAPRKDRLLRWVVMGAGVVGAAIVLAVLAAVGDRGV